MTQSLDLTVFNGSSGVNTIAIVNSVQLSKMMEENESKKVRDENMQELQESSHQLAEQVELLRQQLSASQAHSACLEQEMQTIRYVPSCLGA